jgi:hypothetical protein
MTCRELAELLIDFLNGDLTQEHFDEVQHHLRCCPPCVTFIETYRITIKICRQLPSKPLPTELEKRLRQALQEWAEETDED